MTLTDIENMCHAAAAKQDLAVNFMQSNAEDGIIAAIHAARNDGTEAIIINAAAFTHTSVAIRDAIQMFSGIRIEVHLSNVFAREPFRHHSYLSDIVNGVICGFGADSYRLAIEAVGHKLHTKA
jgi:3-dehydroquinate dehydratase-2